MNLFDLFAKLGLDTSEYESGMDRAAGVAESVAGKIGSALKTAAATITTALGAASTAVGALAKQAVEGFGEFEQLEGGVRTLFGDAADTVMENAENAYKTAGMSANDYLQMVTSFAGSLLKSTSNTTKKMSDQEVKTLSDNLDKQYSLRQRAYSKQETALQRSLNKQYQATQKAFDKQYQAAQKAYDRQYQALSDSVEAEIDKRAKAYEKKEEALERSQQREIDRLEKAAEKRLDLIEKEYEKTVSYIDRQQRERLRAIDDEIAAIQGQSDEEQRNREKRESNDKKEQLEAQLRAAKTKSRRAEIEKELADYMEELEYQKREAARKAQIEALKDRKESIKEEADAQKDAAKSSKDQRVKEINDESKARIDALKEQNKIELEALKEKDRQSLENYKKAKQKELATLRENQQEKLSALKDSQQEELENLKDSQSDQLQAVKDHHADVLAELKKSVAEQKKVLTDATQDTGKNIEVTGEQRKKAAELADMALQDISDNVNKLGTDAGMVQNAYAGFARGNFTMLDNLQLGFSGTKEGMQELLDKAESISGFKYDISSYGDIVQAIHVVQDEMGITGTTAEEASTTIQGSMGQFKAAWQNLVRDFARGDVDLKKSTDKVVKTGKTMLKNLMPAIGRAIKGIGQFIREIAPVVKKELPGLLKDVLPLLTDAATTILSAVIDTLPAIVDALAQQLPPIIEKLWKTLLGLVEQYSPDLADLLEDVGETFTAAFKWISTHGDEVTAILKVILGGFLAFKVVTGIIEAITTAQLLLNIAMTANPIGIIIVAIGALIGALIYLWNTNEGFRDAVIKICKAVKDVTIKLCIAAKDSFFGAINAIKDGFAKACAIVKDSFFAAVNGIKKVWSTVTGFFQGVWEGIQEALANVKQWIGDRFRAAKDALVRAWEKVGSFFSGIWDNIKRAFANVKTWIGDKFQGARDALDKAWAKIGRFFSGIWQDIKDAFQIRDAYQWGKDMVENFTSGISENTGPLFSTLGWLTGKLADNLGFSEPKEGPLSNFHTYAPDMMKLFAQGIRENEKIVTDQIAKSFDFGNIGNIEGTIGLNRTNNIGAPTLGGNQITFNIYQQPGEDMEALAYRIGQILNAQYERERLTFA